VLRAIARPGSVSSLTTSRSRELRDRVEG
jgi:hypothetical protein